MVIYFMGIRAADQKDKFFFSVTALHKSPNSHMQVLVEVVRCVGVIQQSRNNHVS